LPSPFDGDSILLRGEIFERVVDVRKGSQKVRDRRRECRRALQSTGAGIFRIDELTQHVEFSRIETLLEQSHDGLFVLLFAFHRHVLRPSVDLRQLLFHGWHRAVCVDESHVMPRYFDGLLTNSFSSTGMSTTLNGVPASSLT